MSIDHAELEHRFNAHAMDEAGLSRLNTIRAAGRAMAMAVIQTVPEGREQAVALTKLEEAVFWANAGIAREES